jgi:CheY-like chemotaxis protein
LYLDVQKEAADIILYSDQEICQKILSHFLDNSIKFTERGNIHVGFINNAAQPEFYVRDTGIGIAADSFSTIFDRFVKENTGYYKVSEGSGLGLSIAKGMSEAIGGKIRLESEPGTGSCFYLALPVMDRVERFAPGSPLIKNISGELLSPILVAEDDETNFYYLNAVLVRETGAKIFHATNGQEAVDLFMTNPDIKLILMDIKMPVMDGFEATKQIKQINPNIHIIAITAYAMSGDEERIMAAGCDSYLSKPITKKSLIRKIEEYSRI